MKSEDLFKDAKNYLPGGVNSPVRAIKPYPFFAWGEPLLRLRGGTNPRRRAAVPARRPAVGAPAQRDLPVETA